MASTTFSGPVKAGDVREGSGTNVGFAVMAQSAPFIQSTTAAATAIIIPAGSQILDIQITITTACDGASQNLSVGTSATSTELFTALALGTAADTIFFGSAGTITDGDTWENVGTADITIWVDMSAGSAGRGTITVTYVQNIGL
jgi:hypothetical protein